MKERPILFSAPMVRAILAGTKTQTRRAVKWRDPAPGLNLSFSGLAATRVEGAGGFILESQTRTSWEFRSSLTPCPYGRSGDQLWVREAWQAWSEFDNLPAEGISAEARARLNYPASYDGWVSRKRAGIHMPRWASRILLEVTDVRVERLQDISEADAVAEGCKAEAPDDAIGAYEALWEAINGEGSWDADPWVWVVGFRRVGGNG